MQALNRNSVEFDMCPTCRGVWLDRGELEKIIESARAEAGAAPVPQPPQQPVYQQQPQQPYQQPMGGYGERGERGEHGEGGYGHGRRKRGSLFDIFD
jgi:Zn-finger nucleic acid-binding protein